MEVVLGPDERGLALVSTLAEGTETPFYVYDTAIFVARVDALRNALPADGRLLYSVKANPHAGLLIAARDAGCNFEIASLGELTRVLAVGISPSDVLLVGPAKSDSFLAAALAAGIRAVAVESPGELRRLEAAAADLRARDVAVLLRLSLSEARGALRMTGHQFGMDHDDVVSSRAALADSEWLSFLGYHCFTASQLTDVADIVHNTRLVLRTVGALTHEVGAPPSVVDVGGGFGIPYTAIESRLDLAGLASGLEGLVTSTIECPQLLFESGRFLAGPCGALVCRVVDTKLVAGRRFVLLDGGINSSGIFGGTNAVRPLLHSILRDGVLIAGGEPTNICGPLCTPMDRLATGVPCGAETGDLVVWWNMGAYGFTAAPTGFLSFPPPAEVVVGAPSVAGGLPASSELPSG